MTRSWTANAPLTFPILLALTTILVLPAGGATPPEDPELEDPAGDVNIEQAVPAAAGADWADLLALWYEEESSSRVLMHIGLLDAPSIPPPGEVAAHIEVDGKHWVTGYTTVLFPFAIPAYQGGFYCPATEQGEVDPEECTVLPEVTLSDDTLHVPLETAIFGHGPGSAIDTHRVTSGAWYFNVQTVLDEAEGGRTFILQEQEEEIRPGEDAQDEATDPPEGTPSTVNPRNEAEEAPVGTLAILMVLLGTPWIIQRCRRRAETHE